MVGQVGDFPTRYDVAHDPALVLPHVREQRQPVDVPHRVQPLAWGAHHLEPIVDRGVLPLQPIQSNGFQPDVSRVRAPAHRHEDLVGFDLPSVLERRRDGSVLALPANRLHLDRGVDDHPLLLE